MNNGMMYRDYFFYTPISIMNKMRELWEEHSFGPENTL